MTEPMENTPPPGASPVNTLLPSAEERTWGMLAHLSSLLGALLTGALGGGWGCFIGPLVVWLVKKDTMPFVNDQGKEALNFNITIAIISLVLLVLSIVTFGVGLLLAIPLWVILGVYWLVFTIIASVKSNGGLAYRYPLTFRFLK